MLDLTRLLPGAVATLWLANFGAEVIKIEQPGASDYAPGIDSGEASPILKQIFTQTNRGKMSLALDLKDPRGREALLTMAEIADVLIESFRPGVMNRLGCGFDALKERNPQLIYTALTGYGQSGAYSSLAGHDINYLSLAGVLDVIGAKDGPPAIPGVQIADLAGGSMQAVIGILLALAARERTGRGQMVDVSMIDGSAALLAIPLAQLAVGQPPRRGDGLLSGRYACYSLYAARDGRWISIGALESKFWANLCRELGCEGFIADQFAAEPRQAEIKAALSNIFQTRDAEEWFALLGHKDCCLTPVRTVEEAANDPVSHAREIGAIPRLSDTPGRNPASYEPRGNSR